MLQNTFIHIPGISIETEQNLWRNNLRTWDDVLQSDSVDCISASRHEYLKKKLLISKQSYMDGRYDYFSQCLPFKEHWRAYRDFNHCFLDIETTGLSKHRNKITTIGMYDGKESKIFIRGKNLDSFPAELEKYSTIISFNGRRFDVPFLAHNFPSVSFDQLHIDLMYVLRELGYTGGLKRIEQQLGISRDDDISGMGGYEAVLLWKKYERGDDEALRKLVAYNIADVENLKILMDFAFERMMSARFK